MTDAEMDQIEAHVGFPLPAVYRDTLLRYPFPAGSHADDVLLPNRPGDIIEMNSLDHEPTGIGRPFFIGGDGGEEYYFIDASHRDSPVYVYDLEGNQHYVFVATWDDYLNHARELHAEIAADEEAQRLRATRRRWWAFWK